MLHIPSSLPEFLMTEALKEAEKAAALNEVPVGAVLAVNGEIVARAHNRTESDSCVSAHAEILVIQEASRVRKNWRLEDAVLCVTLEPCTMCTGAILLSRIPVVILGAGDSRQGAMGSLYDLSSSVDLRVIRNVGEQRCREILREFFKRFR